MNTWLRIRMQGLDQAPVPQTTQTSDPDPWSRPLIQTFDSELWHDTIYGRVDVLSSDGCLFFWVSCSAIIHPAKQPSNKLLQAMLPSCQASKLHLLLSNQAVYLPMCWAVQQPSCDCCTSKLSSCQADTVVRPCCQAAKLSGCCLPTLSSCSCRIASNLQHTQKCGSKSRPGQTRTPTDPDPMQTQPAPC